jgi:ABC-type antimicrobial peptide transport system permease subunit
LLEATLGFVIGLGLSSLMGQRTVPVVLLIVFELILTPLLAEHRIAHLINAQRGLVGLAMARIQPSSLTPVFGGQNGPGTMRTLPISLTTAICVIIAWIVGWSALGAWRMAKRDV